MCRGNAPLLARKKTDCRSLTRDFYEEFCGFLVKSLVLKWSRRIGDILSALCEQKNMLK